MRLISLHADTVRALERLRVPFSDLTPEGLWGSPYHLIGVTADQCAVLDAWNLDLDDVTPRVLANAPERPPQLKQTWPPRPVVRPGAESRSEMPRGEVVQNEPARPWAAHPERAAADFGHPDRGHTDPAGEPAVAVPMREEPKRHGDPLEQEIVGRAAAVAEGRSGNGATASLTGTPIPGGAAPAAARSGPTRLRVSIGGKYREAWVERGKILLDGNRFETPAEATRSVAPAKDDWVFWEYFDVNAGKWRILDRDWRPAPTN